MANLHVLSELAIKIERAKSEITAEANSVVSAALQNFMLSYPDIKTIWWTQYTPYFNDGDTCVFGVNDTHFSTVTYDEDDIPHYDNKNGFEIWRQLNDQEIHELATKYNIDIITARACSDLNEALRKLGSELQYIFGDHVQVVVTPTKIAIQEFEHD